MLFGERDYNDTLRFDLVQQVGNHKKYSGVVSAKELLRAITGHYLFVDMFFRAWIEFLTIPVHRVALVVHDTSNDSCGLSLVVKLATSPSSSKNA